jgi:uncharacterized membrane-anchored protein
VARRLPPEHPLRRALAGEIHARPHEVIDTPARAAHLALIGCDPEADRRQVADLCARFGAPGPTADAIHHAADLGAFRLRWERHTEFSSYTFVRLGAFDDAPFGRGALDKVPEDWLAVLPGELLTALHVAFEKEERTPEDLQALFGGASLCGARIAGGAAAMATDFRIHEDGFSRILVRDDGLTRGQAGRVLQRLSEIETYRLMALRALPLARELAPVVSEHGRHLTGIVDGLAGPDGDGDDRALLERLNRLAADCERLASSSAGRFSATRAYHALVRTRIADLREERLPGLQTVTEFMQRRLGPAMATCESVWRRLEDLSARIDRAGDLLRTRVNIALEEKNRDLLKSMDRRAHLQLRLQETVEGLSVVAISYYLVGLVGYAAKGLKSAGLSVNPDIAALVALPIVLGMVWVGVRRLRRALGSGHSES